MASPALPIPFPNHPLEHSRHNGDYSRGLATTGPDPGADAGGHRGPDDVVATVVLDADALEGLDVDGVGSAEGRLQLGAAGNAAEHGSHRQVICCVTGIVVKAPPDSLVVCPNPLPSALSSRLLSIGMQCIAMHCIPIQSIANAFHRNGIHTIAMDTYGLTAHGVAAAGGRVAGTTQPFPWRIGGKTVARAAKPAPVRAAKRPLAYVRSLRDNQSYRASFSCQKPPPSSPLWRPP